MAQSYFECMGITYHWEGDYLIPDLVAPEAPHIGVWGLRRKDYLLKSKKPIYTGMLLSGKLNAHLEEVDRSADKMFSQLAEQMAVQEGITEQLKASDQMAWVCEMNNIQERATELINSDIIYE